MPRLPVVAATFLLAALASSCEKPPAATPPPPPAGGAASTWPDDPAGPLWEALAGLPAATHGEAGVLEFGDAFRPHIPYPEPRFESKAWEVDDLVIKRLGLPAKDVAQVIWAELGGSSREPAQDFLIVRSATPVERVREALTARKWTRAAGDGEIWCVEGKSGGPASERILLRDGWLIRTVAGDKAIALLLRTWSGQGPSAQSAPDVRTIVAGLPRRVPALVRFGTKDPPFADTPLRIVGMGVASDEAAGENVRVLALNNSRGPEKMLASEQWKAEIRRQDPPATTDSKESFLRIRLKPQKMELRNQPLIFRTRAEMQGLARAIGAYKAEKGTYPRSLDELREGEAPYISGPAVDPWGNPIRYAAPGPDGRPFLIRSDGPDGVEGTADDIAMAP